MLNRLRHTPFRAYPWLIRFALRRALRRRPPPPAELSDAELDFFSGGPDEIERRLTAPAFHFFDPSDFDGGGVLSDSRRMHARCDSILAHHFDLLGSGPTDLGNPIQWRRDFKTGHQWPREHISKLKLVVSGADVKVPWELSRFQHGLTLALGYVATGDERYPREWAAQFHSWRADNPPEYGPNWGNAMEAAIRAVNWIAAYELMRPALDRPVGQTLLNALIQHGRFIATHLEDYWPLNNHYLADLCGLIWIGLFLRPSGFDKPRRSEAERWLEFGLRELTRQLRIQILPDGASYEASTAYHRFVTEMVASTLWLCELNGVPVPREISATVEKMIAVVEGLRKPDGALPLFGDEDGGRWPHPSPRRSATPLPPLPSFARERGEGPGVGGEVDWKAFPHAGWFIYRSGDEYLAIRAGDNGQAGWGGHAHNDALSFEYAIGARTFLIDPGTFAYTGDPEARNLFRSTAYHNTLRVDGQEISRIPDSIFRLEDDVRCSVQLNALTGWEGEHTGYRRMGVIHRRRFERRADGWLIRDTVTGKGEHLLEWFFHFAPECKLRMEGSKIKSAFDDNPNVELQVANCELRVEEGWVSRSYGQRQRAPVALCVAKAKLPVTIEFIITRR